MTHGSGVMSHGGGGSGYSSFNSGAYSSFALHSTRRSRARSRHSNGSRTTSDCGLCTLIAFLFCLVPMKPRNRIILVWFWLLFLSLLTGLLLSQKTFADQTYSASPTDYRQVTGVSTTFCASVNIQSTSSLDTYLLTSDPVIDKDSTLSYTSTKTVTIHENHYAYWGFYLLENSSVDLLSCASGYGPQLYVIKGKKDLEKWKDNSECTGCYKNTQSINRCVPGVTVPTTTKLTAQESDDYYFLYSNSYEAPADVVFRIDIDRKVYDLSNKKNKCQKSTTCSLDFSIFSSESVVFVVPSSAPTDVTVTVTCHDRLLFYLVSFLLVPCFLGVLISLSVIHYSKPTNQRDSNDDNSSNTNIWSTFDSRNNVSGQDQGVSNQSYSDPPPSYEEAMRQSSSC